MSLPGFGAESSLHAPATHYAGSVGTGRWGTSIVAPALPICGGCETVGGIGSIMGVGRRSCCQQVWKFDPITKRLARTWSCWFEQCTPQRAASLSVFSL
jgi:hypothetical protein